jgi:hypothetical protein
MGLFKDAPEPSDQEAEDFDDDTLVTHKPSDLGEWWLSQTPRFLKGNG